MKRLFSSINICYGKRDEATAGGPFLAMGFKWRHGVTGDDRQADLHPQRGASYG